MLRRKTWLVLITGFFPLISWAHEGMSIGKFTKDPKQSEEWNRGAELVQMEFKCAQCHSPRLNPHEYKISAPLSGYHAPNITQNLKSGIGQWSEKDLDYFLKTGMTPDNDSAGGEMVKVIRKTETLSDADRRAMVVYLKSLKPEGSTMMRMGNDAHSVHHEEPVRADQKKENSTGIK